MQVPSIPPPIVANTVPQELASKAVPNTQAVAPLVQHAVDPTHKTERFNEVVRREKDKHKKERGKEPDQDKEDDKEGDHAVNISI
jgi:hypothetical protein